MKIPRLNGVAAVLISSVALVVVVLAGWFLLVSPQRSKAASLDTQRAAVETELAGDQALLAAPRLKEIKADARSAEVAMPDQPKVSQILRQLTAFAAASRTELDNISPGTPVAVGTAQALPINLTFKGRYFGLQKLLKLLRQSADVQSGKLVATGRLYTVDSIQFNGGDAADLSATLSINAFVYGGTAPAAAPAVPASDASATGTAGS